MTTTQGRCQCGAIAYEFEGAPRWVMHCHCENCRRAVSSAVATYLGVRLEQFRYLKGEPTHYESSPGVKRYFCATCGSPMAYTGERWPGEVHLFHGTLNDPSQWPPTAHGYVADQLPWFEVQRSSAALCRDGRAGRGAGAERAESLKGPVRRSWRLAIASRYRACANKNQRE